MMGHVGKYEFHGHGSVVTIILLKMSFLSKGNVALGIMAINKAVYKAMYVNTGGIIVGREQEPISRKWIYYSVGKSLFMP